MSGELSGAGGRGGEKRAGGNGMGSMVPIGSVLYT